MGTEKPLATNLSLPQISAHRGGALTGTASKAKIKPPVGAYSNARAAVDARSKGDPHRLQNFRSSAHIQQEKSYFNDSQAGRQNTHILRLNQSATHSTQHQGSVRNSMQLIRSEARNEVNNNKAGRQRAEDGEVNYRKELSNDYIDQKRSYFNKSTSNRAAAPLPNLEKIESASQRAARLPNGAIADNLREAVDKMAGPDSKKGDDRDKAYADIRVKLGARKSPGKLLGEHAFMKVGSARPRDDDLESIPSQISDDMWGELPRYQYKLHQEQIKKAKEEVKRKKQLVRTTLDSQLREQQEKKSKDLADAKEFDQRLLARAAQELAEEKRKQERLKQKTLEAKDQRD